MKVLIIYASRTGVTERCATMLSEKLVSSAINIDVVPVDQALPSPDAYDVCIIGGSIRMSAINRKLKKYMRAYADTLNSMHTALFLCCGLSENVDDYVALQIPRNIIPTLGIHYFGGEIKPDKAKGFDKLVLRSMRSSLKYEDFESPDPNANPLPEIIPENISRLADKIRALL